MIADVPRRQVLPAADQVIDSLDVDDLGTAWFGARLAHRRRVTAQP